MTTAGEESGIYGAPISTKPDDAYKHRGAPLGLDTDATAPESPEYQSELGSWRAAAESLRTRLDQVLHLTDSDSDHRHRFLGEALTGYGDAQKSGDSAVVERLE